MTEKELGLLQASIAFCNSPPFGFLLKSSENVRLPLKIGKNQGR